MTPFRQVIYPGDSGMDITAVKRVLRLKGYKRVIITPTAGAEYEAAIRTVQKNHGLNPDGIYGQKTHALIAPLFDKYGVWMYSHAKIRVHNPYVNPFKNAQVWVGRIDQGVDYHGYGPIAAIGNCVISGSQTWGTGWPGGAYLFYRLLDGPLAGRHIYVAEAVIPVVRAGVRVAAGQEICRFGYHAAPGNYPGIETGWASTIQNITYYAAVHGGYREQGATDAGNAFARFLRAQGAPAPDLGPGPVFP